MTVRFLLNRIRRNENGAAAIEFAFLGPILLLLILGVLQVGLGYQSYNAMRSLSADAARYAMVQYQTGNEITDTDIETWALAEGSGAPYMLTASRLQVTVDPVTSRVEGAGEYTITVTYTPDGVLDIVNITAPTLTYARPVFVIDE